MLNLKSLNKYQRESVLLPPENALIIAGAGTGKTKTLISRIEYLVEEKIYQPQEIVALTFTNKAAFEMQSRLENVEGATIGTFHSFALKLIKDDLEGFNMDSVSVISDKEQFDFVRQLFIEEGWELKNNEIKSLIQFINEQKEKGCRANKVEYRGAGIRKLSMRYKVYESKMRDRNKVDFAELLLLLNERLKSDPNYLKSIQSTYKYYLVDEFQDTNPIQYETLMLLSGQYRYLDSKSKKLISKQDENENKKLAELNHWVYPLEYIGDLVKSFVIAPIFAVGDDFQSIYSFRGAVVQNIFDFQSLCRHVVKLERNYRSSQTIVNASSEIILRGEGQIEKKLYTKNDVGNKILVNELFNEYEEAKFIANTIIMAKRANPKLNWSDFSVLYRSNAQSGCLETSFRLFNIPFRVSGGMSFLEREEIKLMLSLGKVLCNPNSSSEFVYAFSKLGFETKANLERWVVESEQEGLSFMQLLDRKALSFKWIDDLFDKIAKHQDLFKLNPMKKVFKFFLESVGYYTWIKQSKSYSQEKIRMENTLEFFNQIEEFEQAGVNFSDFVIQVRSGHSGDDSVVLQTIHASKGLEYPYVFIIGVEDGNIPSEQSIEDNLQEERRLLYVAMTRAKQYLYMTYCKNRFNGYGRFNVNPSRFFLDLDPKYVLPIEGEYPIKGLPLTFDRAQWDSSVVEKKVTIEEMNEQYNNNMDWLDEY